LASDRIANSSHERVVEVSQENPETRHIENTLHSDGEYDAIVCRLWGTPQVIRMGDETMTTLEIRVKPDGERNHLEMYYEGAYIGDYERSIDRLVDAKREEAKAAAHLLVDAYRRYGKIVVRWNGLDRIKEI
jgi:hypothetical protein